MLRNFFTEIFEIFYIWKLEIKKIFNDTGIILFFMVVPLAYPVLYTTLYIPEVIRELPIAVVDYSHSSLSREYIRKIDATPDVSVAYKSNDLSTAKELLKEEKIYGIIYIPQDFSKNIVSNISQAKVSVFSDMGSMLYYKSIMVANTDVSLAMNKDIKIRRMKNMSKEEAKEKAYPIAYEHITLFNPTNGFASFLIPAVLIMILHQTLILGVGLRAGTEREHNRFHDLVSVQKHHKTLQLVLGKALAYFMIYLFNIAYVLFIIPYVFKLPQLGHVADILSFLIPFLMSATFFAMTLSTFVRNRETCIILFVFTSVPLLFISGISWPSSGISSFWKSISYLFPSTFGINGFVRLNSMGARLHQVIFEYTGLWIQTAFYFLTTVFIYGKEVKTSQSHLKERLGKLKKLRSKAN